jgi:hypothetical protein
MIRHQLSLLATVFSSLCRARPSPVTLHAASSDRNAADLVGACRRNRRRQMRYRREQITRSTIDPQISGSTGPVHSDLHASLARRTFLFLVYSNPESTRPLSGDGTKFEFNIGPTLTHPRNCPIERELGAPQQCADAESAGRRRSKSAHILEGLLLPTDRRCSRH